MKNKKQVAIIIDPDDLDEESIICEYDLTGQLTKLSNTKSSQDDYNHIIEFLNIDLPYIKYQDSNPFDILDPDVQILKTRFFKINDAILERDLTISNTIGLKSNKRDCKIEPIKEHYYLPGLPNLIYEDYPMFIPDPTNSIELTNDEIYKDLVEPFIATLKNKIDKKLKLHKRHHHKDDDYLLQELKDKTVYQQPVPYESYFSFSIYEFADVFLDMIFEPMIKIYSELIFDSEKSLKSFFHETDESYHPQLSRNSFVCLKPIGSVGESSFAFGILDPETKFLNQLLVHVEFVNLGLSIGEGYELYFNTEKRNFNENDHRIKGSDFTKKDNFLKIFTKCVSICLNSKTNKFIILDYYWCGLFEIENIQDGEIEDVKKFISKVKLRHFGFSNFEKDDNLTIRNIIASFFHLNPKDYLSKQHDLTILNKKVLKEWNQFLNPNSNLIKQNPNKRYKKSPFIYRLNDGTSFTKQKVDLEASLMKFIEIGYNWSCQTLSIDLSKLFIDKSHYNNLNLKVSPKKPFNAVISIYDEYYMNPDLSLLPRYLKDSNMKFGSTKLIDNFKYNYKIWSTNIQAYKKAESLQGDILSKILDYGALEDKPHNDGESVHLKVDGFYILYEAICPNDYHLKSPNVNDSKHYQLAKTSLEKLHSVGISINPSNPVSLDILKIYKNKVYIINLEETNISPSPIHKRRDLNQLARLFNQRVVDPSIGSSTSNGSPHTGLNGDSTDQWSKRRKSSSSYSIKGISRLLNAIDEFDEDGVLFDEEGEVEGDNGNSGVYLGSDYEEEVE